MVGRSMQITASFEDKAMRVPSFAFAARALLVAVPATLVAGCMNASAARPADAAPMGISALRKMCFHNTWRSLRPLARAVTTYCLRIHN